MNNILPLKFLQDLENGKIKSMREARFSIRRIAEIYGVSCYAASQRLKTIEFYWNCELCGKRYLVGRADAAHLCDDCRAEKRLPPKKKPMSSARKRTLNLSTDDIIAIQNYTRRLTGKYYSYGKISDALYGGNRRYKIEH